MSDLAEKIKSVFFPDVRVYDSYKLICNDQILDLRTRPLTARLFEAFCDSPDGRLSKSDIVQAVYCPSELGRRSKRYMTSLNHNVVKLVSRARSVAESAFRNGEGQGIEWFVYDAGADMWELFRLKNHYLQEQLDQLDQVGGWGDLDVTLPKTGTGH